MFDYAEENFQGISESTSRLIRATYINDFDTQLEEIAKSSGYQKWVDYGEEMSRYILDKPVPNATLPEGFSLHSLADDLDLRKINQVLWRGFNHPGPAPEEEIQGRRESMQAPNFRKDLTIVVVAADGDYVSYSGMWIVPENRIAYVETSGNRPRLPPHGSGKGCCIGECSPGSKSGG